MNVAVVDYGMGNLSSVAKAFEALHASITVTHDPVEIAAADRVVLPGVGAFGEGMKNLARLDLIGPLAEHTLARAKPFLGICLGMELLARDSVEHGYHAGLGWIQASVHPFTGSEGGLKSIHIGWNEVTPVRSTPLFAGLGGAPNFYFVHRYHVVCDNARDVAATSEYGVQFVAAVQHKNIIGVQFHPEKSQEAGLSLLRRFLQWVPQADDSGQFEHRRESRRSVPKVRVIPTLLLKNGRLVKTVQFETKTTGLRRDVGDPIKAPTVYDAQLADELVYLDIHASLEGRDVSRLESVIAQVAGVCFMPVTAGGGIRTLEDIRRLLKAGADKVAINTAVVDRPAFITEAADRFGSQCIVVSIDAREVTPGRYEVFTRSGTTPTGRDPVEWARQAAAAGAGEILLTSIDRDGTMQGYDLELSRRTAEAVDIPIVISGGAGKFGDLFTAIANGGASAVAAASLFHFTDQSPIKAKAFLKREGVPVR